MGPKRSIHAAAYASVGLHLAGLVAAWFWMRPGSMLVGEDARWEYLQADPFGWKLAWCVWMFAAASFGLFALLVGRRVRGGWAHIGAGLIRAAVVLDVSVDTAQAFVLPHRSLNYSVLLDLLSIVVANGLYSIAVPILTRGVSSASMATRGLAWATCATGLGLAGAGLWRNGEALEVLTPATILLSVAWTLSLLRDVE